MSYNLDEQVLIESNSRDWLHKVAECAISCHAITFGKKLKSRTSLVVFSSQPEYKSKNSLFDFGIRQEGLPVIFNNLARFFFDHPAVPGKLIIVDGLKEDWQTFLPIMIDSQGDAVKGNIDIKALYGFIDAELLYLMVEFNETGIYHHIDVNLGVDSDKQTDYVCSIIPGQEDFVFRKGEEVKGGEDFSVLSGIDCKEGEVVEIQIPISLFESRIDYDVRVAFFQEMDTDGYYIDETDWAHVTSLGDQTEEESTATTTIPSTRGTTPIPFTQAPTTPSGGPSGACSPNTQSSAIGDISLLFGMMVGFFGVRQFRKR